MSTCTVDIKSSLCMFACVSDTWVMMNKRSLDSIGLNRILNHQTWLYCKQNKNQQLSVPEERTREKLDKIQQSQLR